MDIRLLRADEYSKLSSDIPEPYAVTLSPDNTIVAAVLDDAGKVKGRLVLINLPHIECAWLDPEIRGGIALARMEALLIEKLKELGAGLALAFAVDEQMESYISRGGYTKFATAWKKEI